MIQAFDDYLFRPGSRSQLGVCRGLFYFWYLVQFTIYQPSQYAELPAKLWFPPLLLSSFPPPDPETTRFLAWVVVAVLALSCIGLFTRLSTGVVAVLGAYLCGVMYGYGFVDFHFTPVILISWVLAFSPSGAAYSVDSLLKTSAFGPAPIIYHWPVLLAQSVLPALMFTAGLQKVAGNWLTQPALNMESFLHYKYYSQAYAKAVSLPDITLSVADQPWLLVAMTLVLVACELGSPLAMIDGKPLLRGTLIGALFLMQLLLAVWLKTLPTFPWLAAYIFWVPWDRLIPTISRGGSHSKE